MMRDFNFLRRNTGKNNPEEVENLPVNTKDTNPNLPYTNNDSSRPPLSAIQEPSRIPRGVSDHELSTFKANRVDRLTTPTKPKGKHSETPPFRTPEKQGVMSKNRFNWGQKSEYQSSSSVVELKEEGRVLSNVNTPGSVRGVKRANSSYSECNSTQNTPTKSVSKIPNQGFGLASGSRSMINGSARLANYAALSKGIPSSCSGSTVVNTVEVPYFELKEDQSFWMEHNVQVLIRVRPLNSMEKSTYGFSRCLKQESGQSVAWIGQPESRFMFDHVACEAIDQETLFRMVGLPMVENCLSGYNSCMFAYGQTGSGKTYTMLGEIEGLEVRPSPNRGMTPRIFEFLFARIRAEEEIRRDEKLKYNCKCSFLEIYNEQITDLLDPSSTNLTLREDMENGVYVENLSEFEVHTVGDILQLLTQGSRNRKVAATNMNRESSRSHSVFTCVIESRWEKDSTTNFRFARLNLVDLAGSERQKSSGAEGERLKEAASINKSLSTLGHVIMVLVDVAQGKPRHIPYRDSRLTFLLQDSLGGNSKTMIIANVSPSICSAAETLNTLKFAQRAKMIQNNAIINEDTSGDIIALKRQIQLLKEELSALKREKVNRSLSFGQTIDMDTRNKDEDDYDNMVGKDSHGVVRVSCKQLKSLETTLAGTMRREQMAETTIKKLEAEIEQLNRLVSQREEDTRGTKMMLKFREDKIQRMESLLSGSLSTDDYLLKEKQALSEENQLLRARLDKNPEVTRFALENIRLLEQVRRFQDLYEEGERELLMTEVSELRNQLICSFDGSSKHPTHPDKKVSDHGENGNDLLNKELQRTLFELEESQNKVNCCLEENAKLRREIEELHASLNVITSATQEYDCSAEVIKESIVEVPLFDNQSIKTTKGENSPNGCENLVKQAEDIMNLQLELDILKTILQEERSCRAETEEMVKSVNEELQLSKEMVLSVTKEYENAHEELEKAKLVIDALESEQISSINEIEDLRNCNVRYEELLNSKELEIASLKENARCQEFRDLSRKHPESEDSPLEAKLRKMHESLEKAKKLNKWYQSDRALQETNDEEMEEARKQVEAETAEVIVCLQEELSVLQQEVEESKTKEMETAEVIVCLQEELSVLQREVEESKTKEMETKETLALLQNEMKITANDLLLRNEDNAKLAERLEEKEKQLRNLTEEWDLIGGEIEDILSGGHEALKEVSDQIDVMSSSIPPERSSVSEKIGKMKKYISEKESLIEELNQCLEGAVDKKDDMECMLRSLRGAVMVMTETHQQECSEKDKEIQLLTSDLYSKSSTVAELQRSIEDEKCRLEKASSCATAAFVIVNRLWELNSNYQDDLNNKDIQLREFEEIITQKDTILSNQASIIDEADKKSSSLQMEIEAARENCSKLRKQLLEEQRNWQAVQLKMEENEIFEASEQLKELNSGVSTLKTCMNDYVNQGDKAAECRTGTRIEEDISDADSRNNVKECTRNDNKLVSENIPKSKNGRDATITLLKTEIESALKSLKEVQAEMAKLRCEKEDVLATEKCSRKSIESLINQAVGLQDAIDKFEGVFELKLDVLDGKLGKMEEIVQETSTSWYQQRELLEAELDDAKLVAAQKSIEASCILEKFEEVQDTVKDADIMINELMIANEGLKLKARDFRVKKNNLTNERNILTEEVQSLKLSNNLKDQNYGTLEKQCDTDFVIMTKMVSELEDVISELQTTSMAEWMSVEFDILSAKSEVNESTKLIRTLLEDVWSEIIVKDCAMSVFDLCHMGILLETANGLNAENGLLQNGLCESNSIVSELREQNFKARKELEMCRVVKGKLLADIKKSFDRISSKVDEAGEVTLKLSSFEKKIENLQIQEEMMLQRSNDMGSELALLMKELDFSNKQSLASIQDQERQLKEKEEVFQRQEENFMEELSAKDIELLVLSTELKQMSLVKTEVEKTCTSTLENFEKDIVFKSLDAAFGELILLDKESQYEKLLEDFKTNETALDVENQRLRENISALEICVAKLEEDLSLARMEIKNHELSQSVLQGDLCLRIQDLQSQQDEANAFKEKNVFLRNELKVHELSKSEYLNALNLKSIKNVDLAENVDKVSCKIHNLITEKFVEVDNNFQKIVNEMEMPYKFVEQFEFLENLAMKLDSGIVNLETELSRKDDIMKGLLFDLSMLQESASNSKDQKDEIERVMASLSELEKDFDLKSAELEKAVADSQILKAQLQENMEKISGLELDIAKNHEVINSLSSENDELLTALEAKSPMEKELIETKIKKENLEMEVAEMEMALTRMSKTTESLRGELDEATCQRDDMDDKVLTLTKELEMAKTLAEENEGRAIEAQEIAELHKINAEEKEEEVKLLERSIEELECTINVLEQKVDIVKGEAEMQRLQREELQLELLAVKEQMQCVENNDSEIKRCLDEKEKILKEARLRVQLLEKEIAARDTEISQCKSHICELNLHAEAQARENKQKLKALESMVEQVKCESPGTSRNASSNKLERTSSKPRGSGSPFKCIGLGLQIKSEREEELGSARQRIEELEGVLAGRQKEIFMLNARLAATESMTHDVLRDLLGVKLNMNSYASLMDNQQLHSLMDEAQLNNGETQVKDQEVANLKQQINEFVKERNGWLEEIERKQAEMMAAHVALEKLRQQDQWLAAENETLKPLRGLRCNLQKFEMINSSNKKKLMDLEAEVKKLSGQQNIQQRIHHHAKIKDENNTLRCQNEELSIKLRRTEAILSRVKEELAQFRAANGKNPLINFDKEQLLDKKLQETEEERLQLAQKLLGLCTTVLKAAGLTKPTSEISISVAEQALDLLKNRVVNLEMELQDVKLKNRISEERIRLSELRPQTSTTSSSPMSVENCQPRNRVSQTTPFLSALDR